ncbi:MAG: hypothetical protein WCT19_04365 [Candidatus Paceibacterota bacterium]|jgi:hypothetical protein
MNNNEKSKGGIQLIVADALRLKDEGKSLRQIAAIFPENEKEIEELFGVVAFMKSKKDEFAPSRSLLGRILQELPESEPAKLESLEKKALISEQMEANNSRQFVIIDNESEAAGGEVNVETIPKNNSASQKTSLKVWDYFHNFKLAPVMAVVVVILVAGVSSYEIWGKKGASEQPPVAQSSLLKFAAVASKPTTMAGALDNVLNSINQDLNNETSLFDLGTADANLVTFDKEALNGLTNTYNENSL